MANWRRGLAGGVLVAALAVGAGCVQRTITITSEPAGALVHLNDDEVGRTPVTVPFTFYGVYDVRLSKEGYIPLWTKAEAKSPWWDVIGVDLLAETVPNARSEHEWHFELQPRPAEDEAGLLDRARQMQALLKRGPEPADQPDRPE
jgi:hypothetical protein